MAELGDMPLDEGLDRAMAVSSRRVRQTVRWLCICFGALWLLENLAFLLGRSHLLQGPAFDAAGLVVFVLVSGVVCYVVAQLQSAPWIRRLVLFGVGLAVLSQCSDLVDNFDFAQASPWLRDSHLLHEGIEHGLFTGGVFALICGSLLAIVEGDFSARRLRLERERLAGLLREHSRVERGLKKARDDVEHRVEVRTAALTDTNEALRARLTEHEALRAGLNVRLRMERGLAACSHALLSESVPLGGGVGKALAVCREAWGCDRVVLCENRVLDDGTLVFGIVFHIRDGLPRHWSVTYPQVTEAYTGGLERWRSELEAGRIIAGAVSSFPPEEQERIKPYRVKSLLAVPLRWRDAWQGCLILTDRHEARHWSEEGIVPLVTLAEMVGAHYDLTSVDEQLRQAHDALERRVAERTASLTLANRRLTEEVAFRKRAEEDNALLESRLRSVQKFQAIATLAGGIAHDFNNILAAIMGFSELGAKRSEGQPRLQRYFEDILASGMRASELVRRLLIFSRQAEHQPVPISLADLAAHVASHLQRSLPEGVALTHRLKKNLPLVLADPERMREALMIVTENAIDAVRVKGGTVEMIADETELHRDMHTSHGILGPGHYVRVIVQDDGPGMSKKTQERVFEPFFTTKGVGEGSGMGLATVHGVVSRHSGAIRLESKPGRGAAFQIFLPAFEKERTNGLVPGLRSGRGVEHVLVLDDEPHLVALWEETLQRYGYRISAFSDSFAARRAFQEAPNNFHLILTDNVMPGLSGIGFARSVLEVRPDIPIIMATGFSDSIAEAEVEAMGIHTLILKPIVGSELVAAVRRALDEAAPVTRDPV